jgi:hypothetical protein
MKFITTSAQAQGPRDYQEDRFFESPSLIAVVDGMGGHADGDLAAQAAIDVVAEYGEVKSDADVEQMILNAGKAVAALAQPGQYRAPGAVIVVAALVDDELIIGWAGDSRAYFNGLLVTRDHVGFYGGIDNCLGAGIMPTVALIGRTVEPGDIVVVASDGMNQVPEDRFTEPDLLMERAKARGLYDNTTFVAGVIE